MNDTMERLKKVSDLRKRGFISAHEAAHEYYEIFNDVPSDKPCSEEVIRAIIRFKEVFDECGNLEF